MRRRARLSAHRSPGPSGCGRWLAHPVLLALLKLVAAGLFILTVIAGFFGNQDPYRNIAPTLVWIIWWVGLAIVSAFVGDLWALVNPWRRCSTGPTGSIGADGRRGLALALPYPEALGVWPAVGLLLAVSWTELGVSEPRRARQHRLAGARLFAADLDRHGRVRQRGLGQARRGFHAYSSAYSPASRRPKPSIRERPAHTDWRLRPFGAGLLDNAARLRLDGRLRPAACCRACSTTALLSTPEWAEAERRSSACCRGSGNRFDHRQDHRSRGVLGLCSSPPISRSARS